MTIDGLSTDRVLQPVSIDDLSQMLSHEKGAVVPIGARTQLHFGNPLQRLDCAIDLTRLNKVSEYVPADLTVHVEAGVRVGDLEQLLAQNNQFVPLDPWNGPSATIGGIAAANAQGPYRATGTIRDWIIGIKVVEANGVMSKAGGRVVKNVTGYDLAKLYTGSIGTLAVIAEISLKVRSKYGAMATAIARFETSEDASRILGQLRTSALSPVSCEWVGPENEIWLRFGEHPDSVSWQLKNLPPADWRILDGLEEAKAWDSLHAKYAGLGAIVLKVIGLPTMVPQIVKDYRPRAWIAHAANGIVLAAIDEPWEILRIRNKYRAVIERAPLEVRREIATFGLDDSEYRLMSKLKHAFDPQGRLNPGRHVEGERRS